MSYAICTLFENTYHLGVAALTNSLYRSGFRGSVYAGYRGALPGWASAANINTSINWKGASTLQVGQGLELHFLPLDTPYHFANYKPQFLLHLLNGVAKDRQGLLYFDPDIVVKCKWELFEFWLPFGIAVVQELQTHDMPSTHPVRLAWKEMIEKTNRTVTHQFLSYLNSGFCGVTHTHKTFLEIWAEFIELACTDHGHQREKFKGYHRPNLFYSCDQDAMNIALMCCGCPVSEMGPEAMDFIDGGVVMSHATARPKPWLKNYLYTAIKGVPPALADKSYWANVHHPLAPFQSKLRLRLTISSIKLAAFIGRFYRRY